MSKVVSNKATINLHYGLGENKMKNWNLLKHTMLSIVLAIILSYAWKLISIFYVVHEAAAIGIIGAADGPTSIFISRGTFSLSQFLNLLASPGTIAFVIIMLLYIPIKRILLGRYGSK